MNHKKNCDGLVPAASTLNLSGSTWKTAVSGSGSPLRLVSSRMIIEDVLAACTDEEDRT